MKKLILLIMMVLIVSIISFNVLSVQVCCTWQKCTVETEGVCYRWEDVTTRSCGINTCTQDWACPEDTQYRGIVTGAGAEYGPVVYGEYQHCKDSPAKAIFCTTDENKRRCCSATNDCVYSTISRCMEAGSAHHLMGGDEADAVCVDQGDYGEWFDCDNDASRCADCDAATDLAGCSGSGCFIRAGESDVGEYDAQGGGNQCCGDDNGEYVITGFGYTVCCNNPNDCVDSRGVCRIGIEICDDGVDNDCDGLIDMSDTDCGVSCPPETYYRFKECAPGVCETNESDWACCSYEDDCVFDGVCYLDADRAAWLLGNETNEKCEGYGSGKKGEKDCKEDKDCDWNDEGGCKVKHGMGMMDVKNSKYSNQVFNDINPSLAGDEYCDPGTWWSEGLGNSIITGIVYNLNGEAIIESVRITALGRGDGVVSYEDYSDEFGVYSMTVVGDITYDVSASKTDYVTQTKSVYVASGTTETVDFYLRFNSNCDSDCTYFDDDLCHADCDNDPNGCKFYDTIAIEKCATPPNLKQPGFVVQYDSDQDIVCCDGEPYLPTPYKAVTKVNTTGNIVTIRKPVWYGGKLVNMVITFFD